MGVCVVAQQVHAHRVDDRGGNLRPARTIKISNSLTPMDPLQGGKGAADIGKLGSWPLVLEGGPDHEGESNVVLETSNRNEDFQG